MFKQVQQRFLEGAAADFVNRSNPDLLKRWDGHWEWWQGRLSNGVDPYSKCTFSRIAQECCAGLRNGQSITGPNFASQDYLNLSSDPEICAAVHFAVDTYGTHSAGSAALMGNTSLSSALERELADFLGYVDCTVFPTGWGAGYGAIRTLVGSADHVIIDVLAHACLQEGAHNASRNVHTVPHLSNKAIARRLNDIRREDAAAGVLVVTETVFSMDSDVPSLMELQHLCHEYKATLFVDVAHDLGALGPRGLGYLEDQQMVGKIDVLMGSFSKTFASNGGFVACNNPALKLAFRYNAGPLLFTNAISPLQAAVIRKALEIVKSPAGAKKRALLLENILYARAQLEAAGFRVLGQPSAIVPVVLGGNALARLATKYVLERGVIVNLVEHPAVARNSCRWRIQMMASHTREQIDQLVEVTRAARAKAEAHIETLSGSDLSAALTPSAAA